MRLARPHWGKRTPGLQRRAMKYPANRNNKHMRPELVNHNGSTHERGMGACVIIVPNITSTRETSTQATRVEGTAGAASPAIRGAAEGYVWGEVIESRGIFIASHGKKQDKPSSSVRANRPCVSSKCLTSLPRETDSLSAASGGKGVQARAIAYLRGYSPQPPSL